MGLFTLILVCVFVRSISCDAIESEINLSSPPLIVCECALSGQDDPCKENYKDWFLIISDLIQDFNGEKISFLDLMRMDRERTLYQNIGWREIMQKRKSVVVLETGNTINRYLFVRRESIVFCPRSISTDLKEMTMKQSKNIYLAPESIAERNLSLSINLQNIEQDIHLPTSLYDYQYKISDYIDSPESSDPVNETSPRAIFRITFRDVGNVVINSNSISAKSLFLIVEGAKSLTIETLAVRVEPTDSTASGISIGKIGTVKLENSWGRSLSIASCSTVYLFPNSVSKGIYHFAVYNVTELKHYKNTLNLSRFNSVINIKSWYLQKNSFGPQDANSSRGLNETLHHNMNINNGEVNALIIKDTNMILEGDMPSEILEFMTDSISITNSTFDRQEESNITVLFIGKEFDLKNQEFPEWVHLCQINKSVECDANLHICPVGLPYPVSNKSSEHSCQLNNAISVSHISSMGFYIFLALGILALVISIVVAIALIYRYEQISGKWSPHNAGSNYSPFKESTMSNQHHIICVSAWDDPIGTDRFPRHFTRRLSPFPYSESGVQFYAYRDDIYTLPLRGVHRNDESCAKKLSNINVQLLNVKPHLDDVHQRGAPASESSDSRLLEN